jgi:microcystin-dependent protein
MSAPFVAEIRIFPFDFAPVGWALCSGQLLPISQNTALFSLLGTFYGGDGKSTFGLPNLNGCLPTHAGANQPGPGLKYWDLGEMTGEDYVTLIESEMPQHNHLYTVTTDDTDTAASALAQTGKAAKGNPVTGLTQARMYSTAAPQTQLHFATIATAGGSQPHNNRMPYLTLSYCIAMQGVFPPRG